MLVSTAEERLEGSGFEGATRLGVGRGRSSLDGALEPPGDFGVGGGMDDAEEGSGMLLLLLLLVIWANDVEEGVVRKLVLLERAAAEDDLACWK